MKRLGMCACSALLCVSLIALAGGEGQDKKPAGGDKTKKDGKDMKEKKARPIYGTIELKDGSAIQCEFVAPKDMAFQTPDLGLLALPFEQIRFVDLEGASTRVATFTPDVYLGTIETTEFKIKLLSTGKGLTVLRDNIKRMTFPDPPPPPLTADPPPMPPVIDPAEKIDPPKEGEKL